MKTSYTSTNHRFYIQPRTSQPVAPSESQVHTKEITLTTKQLVTTTSFCQVFSSVWLDRKGQLRGIDYKLVERSGEARMIRVRCWVSHIYIHSAGTFSSCHSWQLEDVTPQGTIHQNPHRFTPELLQFPPWECRRSSTWQTNRLRSEQYPNMGFIGEMEVLGTWGSWETRSGILMVVGANLIWVKRSLGAVKLTKLLSTTWIHLVFCWQPTHDASIKCRWMVADTKIWC